MVCMRVALHENDGNHENDENGEDNSDSYKQGVECWIRGNHGNHGNDENDGNPWVPPRKSRGIGQYGATKRVRANAIALVGSSGSEKSI